MVRNCKSIRTNKWKNKKPTNQSSDYDSISFLSSNYKCRYGKANRCKSKRKTDYRASKYSVEIIRKQNEFYVNITFDETEIGRVLDFKETPQSDVIAGIDVNPDRIAVSLCTKQGNFKGSKFLSTQSECVFNKQTRNDNWTNRTTN